MSVSAAGPLFLRKQGMMQRLPVGSKPVIYRFGPYDPMSKLTAAPGTTRFRDLNLSAPLLKALDEIGYETPTPIQVQAIPHLLKGLDILGHAPTGTGKTAAFALPLLSNIDVRSNKVQVLTLTPTRELAIQVAEAFQRYASQIRGFHVLPKTIQV